MGLHDFTFVAFKRMQSVKMSLYQPEMLGNNVFYLCNDHHLLFNRIANACTWSSSSLLFEVCDEQNEKEKNSRDDFVTIDNIVEYE